MKFMQILMQVIAKFSIINSDLGLKFFHSMLLITKLFYRNVCFVNKITIPDSLQLYVLGNCQFKRK